MIFGMPAISFFVFLSWPITFTVGAIIAYIIMDKNDKKEEAFEKAYVAYMKELGKEVPGGGVIK
ncbi:hypothetical protein QBE52_14860 [Clostridiaceae bacterium 35-E11]